MKRCAALPRRAEKAVFGRLLGRRQAEVRQKGYYEYPSAIRGELGRGPICS
jgi:hypothetical protein